MRKVKVDVFGQGAIVREVARREALAIGHVRAVLATSCAVVGEQLAAGRAVALNGLGTISPTAAGARFRPAAAVKAASAKRNGGSIEAEGDRNEEHG